MENESEGWRESERGRMRKHNNSHILVHYAGNCDDQVEQEPKLEAGNTIQVSKEGGRNPNLWAISTASEGLH